MALKKKTTFIIGVILFAFIVRLCFLGTESFWIDEVFSVRQATSSLSSAITNTDIHPPFYYVLLWAWIKVFGLTEFAVRSLTAILGALVVFVGWLLTKEVFDEKTANISALFLAVAPVQIAVSQEARPYMLLFLMSTLSVWRFLIWKKKPDKKNTTLYVLASVGTVYSHIFGWFVLFSEGLLIISEYLKKKDNSFIKKAGIAGTIISLSFVPWIYILLKAISLGSLEWIPSPSLLDLFPAFLNVIQWLDGSFFGILLVICIFILLGKLKKDDFNKGRAVWLWFLFSFLGPFIASYLIMPVFTPRYLYISSIPLFILVARGVSLQKKKVTRLFVLIILSLSLLIVLGNFLAINKDRWKDVSLELENTNKENSPVLIMAYYEHLPLSYYAYPSCFLNNSFYSCLKSKGTVIVKTIKDVENITTDRLFFVLSREQYVPEAKDILSSLEGRYTLTYEHSFRPDNKKNLGALSPFFYVERLSVSNLRIRKYEKKQDR